MTEEQINKWIEREFEGHGVALGEKQELPIPGGPLMSMADAKNIVRKAFGLWDAESLAALIISHPAFAAPDAYAQRPEGIKQAARDLAQSIVMKATP